MNPLYGWLLAWAVLILFVCFFAHGADKASGFKRDDDEVTQ
jgi:hypothetical protein